MGNLMVNFAAITGALESPCKKCYRCDEDKEECIENCKTIKEFQKYLDGYRGIFSGKIIDIEDAYPIRYWGFEDSINIDKFDSEATTYIPVGINVSTKGRTIRA